MFRRLATLALIGVLALGNLAICPSGRCAPGQAAGHDCCAKGPGVKGLDCCPALGDQSAPRLPGVSAAERVAAFPMLSQPFAASAASNAAPALAGPPTWLARGPAPPASLVERHTSLLL